MLHAILRVSLVQALLVLSVSHALSRVYSVEGNAPLVEMVNSIMEECALPAMVIVLPVMAQHLRIAPLVTPTIFFK